MPLSKTGAELLFEVFSQRYERTSTMVTSNLPFSEWTETLGSERLTGALLDRLTHHVHILEIMTEVIGLTRAKRVKPPQNLNPKAHREKQDKTKKKPNAQWLPFPPPYWYIFPPPLTALDQQPLGMPTLPPHLHRTTTSAVRSTSNRTTDMLEQHDRKTPHMRLQGMADALKTQEQDPGTRELSFVDRLSLLVDQQWNWRENQALARRLKSAKLRHNACVEDIDYRAARGLEKTVIRGLAKDSQWVQNHENLFVLGPTGVGKSFIACALAQKACRDGYSAFYTRAAALFRDLALARADGSFRNLLARLSRIDVLVIDDWAMAPLSEPERRDFWEICEDRYQVRSLILTSQLPVTRWHEQIGDPTVADGILDRLVHNAHRIEMRGDSMRKSRSKPDSSQ